MEEGLSCPLRIFILSRSGEEIMWSRSELTLCVKGRGWSGNRSKGKITPWCDLAGTPRGAPDASALSGNGLLPPSRWQPYLLAPAPGCTPGCHLTSSCSMLDAHGARNPVGTMPSVSSQAPAERVFCRDTHPEGVCRTHLLCTSALFFSAAGLSCLHLPDGCWTTIFSCVFISERVLSKQKTVKIKPWPCLATDAQVVFIFSHEVKPQYDTCYQGLHLRTQTECKNPNKV